MKKIILFLLVPLVAFCYESNVDKDMVLHSALSKNPSYHGVLEDTSVQYYSYLQTYSAFLPSINLSYDSSNNWKGKEFFKSETYRASASLNVFQGFKSYSANRMEALRYESAKILERDALLKLIRDVNVAYQGVMRADLLRKTAETSYIGAVLLLDEAKEKQDLDLLTQAEIYKAMADKEKAYSSYLDAETNYAVAVLELKMMSGLDLTVETTFVPLNDEYVLYDLQSYIDSALLFNASILRGVASESISAYSYGSSYGNFLPSVDLTTSTEWDKLGGRNSHSAGITVSLNIFSGFGDTAQAISRFKEWNSSGYRLASTRNDVIQKVNLLWLQASTSDKKLASAELYLRAAEENYTASLEMFRLGRASLKDTIDSRATLEDAQASLADAHYSRVQIYEDLNVATGGFLEVSTIVVIERD